MRETVAKRLHPFRRQRQGAGARLQHRLRGSQRRDVDASSLLLVQDSQVFTRGLA